LNAGAQRLTVARLNREKAPRAKVKAAVFAADESAISDPERPFPATSSLYCNRDLQATRGRDWTRLPMT
jgi:hypothetical protein